MTTTALHGGTTPLAAVTTVFTPTCSTSWLLTSTKLLSQHPSFPGAGPSGCDPPSWVQNLDGQGFQYYSPAICPDGFAVGTSCIISTQTKAGEGFPPIAPGETAAWCVPSGMTCTGDTTDFRGGFWGFTRAAATTNAPVTYGPIIQIRWVDADLSKLETHPLTPGLVLAGATVAASPLAATTVAPVTTTAAGLTVIQGTSTGAASPATTPAPTSLSRTVATMGRNTIASSQSESVSSDGGGNGAGASDSDTVTVQSTGTDTPPASRVDGLGPPEGATSSSNSSSGAVGGDPRANIAIVVLLSLLVAALLVVLACAFIRRRRSGQFHLLIPHMPAAAVRLRVNRGQTYRYSNSMQSARLAQRHSAFSDRGADPELGAEHPPIPPIQEMAYTPAQGTESNPAELPGDELRAGSWMARVSGIFPWLARPSTPSQTPSRPSSRWTATTSYTADRKSFGSEKLPGLQVPVPVRPGTAKIISIYRNKLAADELPPLPDKNALGLQVPPSTRTRLNRGSGGTFGAPAASVAASDAASEGALPSPRPEPPDKDGHGHDEMKK